jgi:hypothetical protein
MPASIVTTDIVPTENATSRDSEIVFNLKSKIRLGKFGAPETNTANFPQNLIPI